MSKCRAVLGTAFAGVGRSWVVGVMTGSGFAGLRWLGLGVGFAWVSGGLRKRSEAECGACMNEIPEDVDFKLR